MQRKRHKEADINVKANVGDNLTVTGGNILQTNVSGNITEITIKVNDGYYLPDDYISNLQGQLNTDCQ